MRALSGFVKVSVAAAVAVVGLGVAPGPAPAAAAPTRVCGQLDLGDQDEVRARADAADNVFVGEVTALRRVRGGGEVSSSAGATQTDAPDDAGVEWRHTVDVKVDYRGLVDAGSTIRVTIANDGGDTTGRLLVGDTYLFFAADRGNRVAAEPCTGAVLLEGGLTAGVEERLSEALVPAQAEAVDPNLALSDGVDEDPPAIGRMVAPAGALALVGVLGLALVGRIGRERR